MKKKKKKRVGGCAQHPSENVPDPTDNNMNIKRAPAHYEQKNHIHFKENFDDLQSRIANLKSIENFKKEFKRDWITIKNGVQLICCLSFKLF